MSRVRSESRVPDRPLRRRRWRPGPHFDRWALLAVVALQAAILALRHDTRRAGAARRTEAAPEQAPATASRGPSAQAADRSAATPVLQAVSRVQGRVAPSRLPVSSDSTYRRVSWQSLRHTPTLDMRECERSFTVLLSVPARPLDEPTVGIVGRRLDVEVPLGDWRGDPAGRHFRQVLLPGEPSRDATPAMDYTNGILRIRIAKAPLSP